MTKPQDNATQANHRLIAQVAEYYNYARENLIFYKELNSISLQEMSKGHLRYWKRELHRLIFNGLNCTDKKSA
jgi:hypothetical protein